MTVTQTAQKMGTFRTFGRHEIDCNFLNNKNIFLHALDQQVTNEEITRFFWRWFLGVVIL